MWKNNLLPYLEQTDTELIKLLFRPLRFGWLFCFGNSSAEYQMKCRPQAPKSFDLKVLSSDKLYQLWQRKISENCPFRFANILIQGVLPKLLSFPGTLYLQKSNIFAKSCTFTFTGSFTMKCAKLKAYITPRYCLSVSKLG